VGPVVALHHQLVRPHDELEPVGAIEALGDVRAKGVARAPGAYPPSKTVVRVGPHEVANGAFVRHFLHPLEPQDLIHVVEGRAQAAMRAENGVVNRGR